MKTIIITALFLGLLAFTACSKKSSSNKENSTKFPDNIASTWNRTAVGGPGDTTTDSNTGQKWVADIVILTSSEAAKLPGLIQAVPKQLQDDFAVKFKKFMDKDHSPEFAMYSTSQPIMNTQEYKDFSKFCADSKDAILSLTMGYLFNDEDGKISSTSRWGMDVCTEGRFDDLKKEVADERLANQYTEDGKYRIYYTPVSLQRRLAKKILNQ
ncbi:MAG TPA: hypothetical protein PKY86_08090 [Niabella sp.]|nr:hypothetical protein [Niabella sp.]HQX21628.1 hypothetical protein [Niabella sp.]HQX42191.1 hypothetical protein [Niabella sp.]HRB80151.1 hypothetical protein [Niabella sp.]HRC22283.1 hypothetical protein [Niabella sp.]